MHLCIEGIIVRESVLNTAALSVLSDLLSEKL